MAIFILKLLYSLFLVNIFYLLPVLLVQNNIVTDTPDYINNTEEVIIEDVKEEQNIEDESVEIISEQTREIEHSTVSRSGIDRPNLEDIINQNTELIFIKPVEGGYISSNYGYRKEELHTGVDIAVVKDTEIYASADGIISFAGWCGGYGNLVIIDHAEGYKTYYAHCNSLNVEEGQEVKQKDVIAYVGSTGRSTGYHVHFEIRKDKELLNPNDYTELI